MLHVCDRRVDLRDLGVTVWEIIEGIEETRIYEPCPTVFDLIVKRLFQFDNLFYCFTVPDMRLQSCNMIHVVVLMSCVYQDLQ